MTLERSDTGWPSYYPEDSFAEPSRASRASSAASRPSSGSTLTTRITGESSVKSTPVANSDLFVGSSMRSSTVLTARMLQVSPLPDDDAVDNVPVSEV